MKTKCMIAVICLCASISFSSCQKASGEVLVSDELDEEKIKSEIMAMESAYAESLNLSNVNGVAAYFADDAKNFMSGMQPENSKSEILAGIKTNLKMMPEGSKINFKTDEFMISNDGNQVVELGTYTLSSSTNPTMITGNFMSVFEKRDGKYLCVRHMSVDNGSSK